MYVSFETNIQISNFVFEYPNIRIFSEYSNIRLSPKHQEAGFQETDPIWR